jgi:hypothetical protein
MFPGRYFPVRMFCTEYFCKVGATALPGSAGNLILMGVG